MDTLYLWIRDLQRRIFTIQRDNHTFLLFINLTLNCMVSLFESSVVHLPTGTLNIFVTFVSKSGRLRDTFSRHPLIMV